MGRSSLIAWGIVVSAGCLGISPLAAEDNAGVIRDASWTIAIRPAARGAVSPREDSNQAGPTLTPVGREAAPTPEVPPVPETKAAEHASEPIGPPMPPTAAPVPGTPPLIGPRTLSYAEAYASVPFSRTEYEANPGYRHLAALELMFGVLRPTTMVQQYTPRASRYPDSYQFPYGRSDTQHINLRTFGGGYNFNGQSPFGYPYGLHGNW